jgi:hypothetical protein
MNETWANEFKERTKNKIPTFIRELSLKMGILLFVSRLTEGVFMNNYTYGLVGR